MTEVSSKIGIMQGRLSPPINGRIQAFPEGTWRHEFHIAQQLGLSCIEWVHQRATLGVDPISTDEGIAEIRTVVDATGVNIHAITADYFMEARLIEAGGAIDAASLTHLQWLLARAAELRVHHVMVPLVDSGRLRDQREISAFTSMVRNLSRTLQDGEVELHMESDLEPEVWRAILMEIGNPMVRVCFDTGDRASLGFDPELDLRVLGQWVGSVHIKDRMLGGSTVPLGRGAANFVQVLPRILRAGFHGPFILQVARTEDMPEPAWALQNIKFLLRELAKFAVE
jgi:L-ribulose-5-phosphate 3-epimerase